MATLHAYPTLQVSALDDSWELSSEGSIEYIYEDDAFTITSLEEEKWTREKAWPNRGRFNNLPSLSALIKHHCPPPLMKPEPLDPELRELWTTHQAQVGLMEKERISLADKMNEIEKELTKAEKAPQNYAASRWGATSARDALVKRLTADMNAAYEKVCAKGKEIEAYKASHKNLGELVASNDSMMEFYERCQKEKEEHLTAIYGHVEPIRDHTTIAEHIHGAKMIYSEQDFCTYICPTPRETELAMRRLELGGFHHLLREGLTRFAVFSR